MSHPQPTPQDDGITAIAVERTRQQTVEGYTRQHDAEHKPQVIIDAALAYVVQAQDKLSLADGQGVGADGPETYWPWGWEHFRQNDDELRSLAKAGALAAAYDAAVIRRGGELVNQVGALEVIQLPEPDEWGVWGDHAERGWSVAAEDDGTVTVVVKFVKAHCAPEVARDFGTALLAAAAKIEAGE